MAVVLVCFCNGPSGTERLLSKYSTNLLDNHDVDHLLAVYSPRACLVDRGNPIPPFGHLEDRNIKKNLLGLVIFSLTMQNEPEATIRERDRSMHPYIDSCSLCTTRHNMGLHKKCAPCSLIERLCQEVTLLTERVRQLEHIVATPRVTPGVVTK